MDMTVNMALRYFTVFEIQDFCFRNGYACIINDGVIKIVREKRNDK